MQQQKQKKPQRKHYNSFRLGDLFPEKPGIFPKDVEREYDDFIEDKKRQRKDAVVAWRRQRRNQMASNRSRKNEER